MVQPITLVCFAVKEEAKPFQRAVGTRSDVKILVSGMGQRNAEKAIRAALAAAKPALVLTCGFAGGLNPELKTGDIVFSTENHSALDQPLRERGARPAKIHFATRVAATAAEKALLRKQTGADAVEMESQAIAAICVQQNVPCVTVRVILDTAGEDLPLDFNALMTPDMEMNFGKLIWTIVKSPGKIPALMRLGKESKAAAEKLAAVLVKIIAA